MKEHITLKNFAFGSLLGLGGMTILGTWEVHIPHDVQIVTSLGTLAIVSFAMIVARIFYVKGNKE